MQLRLWHSQSAGQHAAPLTWALDGMSDISPVLELFSEIAIGFLGFTALIAIVSGKELIADTRDSARGMVSIPIIFLLASVTPLVIQTHHVISDVEWRSASAIVLLFWMVDFAVAILRSLRDRLNKPPPIMKALPMLVLATISYGTLAANAFGFFDSASFGYLAGVFFLLMTSCLVFFNLVTPIISTKFGLHDD
jgi:hypothetical protein